MTESPATEPAPAPTVTFKKRGARPKAQLVRKREKPESDSSSSEDDMPQSRKAKRRNQGAEPAAGADKKDELFATVYEADRNADLKASNDATKQRTKIGPTHVATNVRATTMMDYAPDVCKDVRTFPPLILLLLQPTNPQPPPIRHDQPAEAHY